MNESRKRWLAASRAIRRSETITSAAVRDLAGLFREPWEDSPQLFNPLFERYGIKPGSDRRTLKSLIYEMARKHEPGFKRKRGRSKNTETTPQQWQDLLVYCYVESHLGSKGKNATFNKICNRAFSRAGVTLNSVRARYNRGKKIFKDKNADASDALKCLRIKTLGNMLDSSAGNGLTHLDKLADSRVSRR